MTVHITSRMSFFVAFICYAEILIFQDIGSEYVIYTVAKMTFKLTQGLGLIKSFELLNDVTNIT